MATRNKITEQRIEREKVMEQIKYQQAQGRIELRKTWRQITDAEISIRQQELAVEQASEALRIIQNRYGQGLVTTQDVLQSHTLLQQQKLKQAEVIFQYNTTHAYLQLLTATSDQ
jgi:outer membrane protein TolC